MVYHRFPKISPFMTPFIQDTWTSFPRQKWIPWGRSCGSTKGRRCHGTTMSSPDWPVNIYHIYLHDKHWACTEYQTMWDPVEKCEWFDSLRLSATLDKVFQRRWARTNERVPSIFKNLMVCRNMGHPPTSFAIPSKIALNDSYINYVNRSFSDKQLCLCHRHRFKGRTTLGQMTILWPFHRLGILTRPGAIHEKMLKHQGLICWGIGHTSFKLKLGSPSLRCQATSLTSFLWVGASA